MKNCACSSVPGLKGLCLCAALGAAALWGLPTAGAAELSEVQETLDVRYHNDSERQRLDVAAPAGARGAPVVLFIHGGSWMYGDKNRFGLYRGLGRFLAQHGVVAVMANYRLTPAVRHPEHVKDVARAFAWTRRHVAEYGGDPDRIILCGHSAGGHLVSLLATDESYLKIPELKLGPADWAAIKGVIGVCGVYHIPAPAEFDRMADGLLGSLLEEAGVDMAEVAGIRGLLVQAGQGLNPFPKVFGRDPEVCRLASPVNHVRKGLPPFLLLHAEEDFPGLPEMAREFTDALRKAGNTVDLLKASGRTHRSILFQLTGDDPVGEALLSFIARHAATKP
jgi:acetyl esterase/lipase